MPYSYTFRDFQIIRVYCTWWSLRLYVYGVCPRKIPFFQRLKIEIHNIIFLFFFLIKLGSACCISFRLRAVRSLRNDRREFLKSGSDRWLGRWTEAKSLYPGAKFYLGKLTARQVEIYQPENFILVRKSVDWNLGPCLLLLEFSKQKGARKMATKQIQVLRRYARSSRKAKVTPSSLMKGEQRGFSSMYQKPNKMHTW